MPVALITGVTGQDGSYLAERLHGDGWDVHALVRPAVDPAEQVVPDWVSRHVGDLLDAGSLSAAVAASAPDAVFNLAGITSVARSWEEPELTAKATGTAVAVLLDAALREQERTGRPVSFVQATSAEIFGAATEVPQRESTPIRPVNPYGAAKAYAHHLVGVYRERGLAASSAILYNHESPRRPPAFVTRKITAGVARIARGLDDRLVLGNLDAERDWGWAPDYVDALTRMPGIPGDYVIATGRSHTVRDFVAAAFAAAGIEDWEPLVSVDAAFIRPTDAPLLRGDASLAAERLGWAPTVAFEELVRRMVAHDLELLSR